MADFRNRVVSILDRIYAFTSSRTAPNQVDLQLPIQLVHAVEREAELGKFPQNWFGLWTLRLRLEVQAGHTTVIGAFPYSNPGNAASSTYKPSVWTSGPAGQFGLVWGEIWDWIVDLRAGQDGSGTLSNASVDYIAPQNDVNQVAGYLDQGAGPTGTGTIARELLYFTSLRNSAPPGGSATISWDRPLLWTPNHYIKGNATESGGTNSIEVDFEIDLLQLPFGVFPPGFA